LSASFKIDLLLGFKNITLKQKTRWGIKRCENGYYPTLLYNSLRHNSATFIFTSNNWQERY